MAVVCYQLIAYCIVCTSLHGGCNYIYQPYNNKHMQSVCTTCIPTCTYGLHLLVGCTCIYLCSVSVAVCTKQEPKVKEGKKAISHSKPNLSHTLHRSPALRTAVDDDDMYVYYMYTCVFCHPQYTPLMLATTNGKPAVVKVLLRHGSQATQRMDVLGESLNCLEAAIEKGKRYEIDYRTSIL